MTNCFDKVRLQQLIAETSHVENLAANVFHLFFKKMQEAKQEMKTAALLPVEEAKDAIQDLICRNVSRVCRRKPPFTTSSTGILRGCWKELRTIAGVLRRTLHTGRPHV